MSDFPAIYKPILPLFRISLQFEKRDITTAYWARFQCLQLAMKIDSKDKDGRMWLRKNLNIILVHVGVYFKFNLFNKFSYSNGLARGGEKSKC